MADAEFTASLNLVNGILTQINKDIGVNASFARHACRALLSQPILGVTAGIPSVQKQQTADVCSKVFAAVGKLVAKGSFSEQALVIQILAACIQSCDSVSLLERAVGWGAQLTDAIRRSEVGGAADATAATAPAGAAALAQAACAAAAVLFGRLQSHIELPGVRRETTSIVPKLMPQLLSLLQTAHQLPCSCQVAALQLLAALLRCVPAALRSTAPMAERALQQIVLAAATSTGSTGVSAAAVAAQQQVLAQAAVCAALLPAAQGDAATWSETARKLLSSSHDVLDYLLMGLEGRPTDPQYRSYLAAPAADTQPSQPQQQPAATAAPNGWLLSLPWQQQQQHQGAAASTAASRRQTTPARMLLSMCISAVQHLVQQPFAAPVPVPGYSLALLAARLLQFDAGAAVSAGAVAGSSTMYQEVLVLQPQLQQAGWQLLQLVVDVAGQQLQLQGLLLRVARQGLRGVQLSGRAALLSRPASVRCCIYATASQLLRTTGLAGARALAAEAMGCAVLELYASAASTDATGGAMLGGSKGGQRPAKRAKTSGGASGNDFEQFDAAASAAAGAAGDDVNRVAVANAADLAAQTSALQLLRAMLEAGGQLLPANVRAHADAVAYNIAQTTAAAALRLQQQPAVSSMANSSGSALGSLQVAAYQALLASLLVPCGHRPPFLSQAALLFRQGRSSSNPALAAVCQAAAVQCESLLHPRATPMSSVRQYAGMDAVKPLTKPRMWTAVDAVVTQVTAVGASHDRQVTQDAVQRQQQAGTEQQRADAAGADSSAAAAASRGAPGAGGLVVVGYPVNLPTGQQQQQHTQSLCAPVGASTAGALHQASDQGIPVPAADPCSAAMDKDRQELRQTMQKAQQQQQPIAVQDVTQQPHQVHPVPVITEALNGCAPKGSAQAVRTAEVAAPAAAGAAAPAAAPHAHNLLPSTEVLKTSTAVFDEESSDSEGPLPDIDSGAGSSDEEQEEE